MRVSSHFTQTNENLFMKIREFISNLLNKKGNNKLKPDENLWKTNIHPLFIQMKEKATLYLLENGYSIFNQTTGIETFKNDSGIYISIVNQGYDFPEVYIGKNERIDKMILLDFILELYLTDKNELFKKHESMKNFYDFEYEKDFIETHYESILKTIQFPEKYTEWVQSNDKLIQNQTIE